MAMLFLIGTFGLNFPIFISTMAVNVFHRGAGQFGVLTSMMAIGSVTGALLSAGREKPRVGLLVVAAFVFGAGLALGAVMPIFVLYGAALIIVGIAAQTFTTTCASVCQLSTEPTMRGRVMAIFMAIALGGTPIGAPIVGHIADSLGPRWGVACGAAGGLLAALVGVLYRITAPRQSSRHAPAASPTTPDKTPESLGCSDRDSASHV
jgi:predicted MFS family arabinose efflux permease